VLMCGVHCAENEGNKGIEAIPGRAFWSGSSGNSDTTLASEEKGVGDPCLAEDGCGGYGLSCWPANAVADCVRVGDGTCGASHETGYPPCCNDLEPEAVCTNDLDCESGLICAYDKLYCSCNDAWSCIPGCLTDEDCLERKGAYYPPMGAIQCTTDFHCVGQVCTTNTDCPSLYDCVSGANGQFCARQQCSASAECEAGVCTAGFCFEEDGICGSGQFSEGN
jgi:hypothetical protein